MATDYILFILQDANFQTRSMLVPKKEFLEVRQADFDILKRNAITVDLPDGQKIDNLLIQNFIWENNLGIPEEYEWSAAAVDLLMYASEFLHNYECNDDVWYKKSFFDFCDGFNDLQNYLRAKKITELRDKQINVTDSFLILESDNGQMEHKPYDTVEEMLTSLYLTN